MPKLIDLTGQKFSRLTVLRRYEQNSKDNNPQWVCQCDCGNIAIVQGCRLRGGRTRSCGCLQKEAARNTNYIDITNIRFGHLVALKDIGSNSQGSAIWECECDCGNIIRVKGIDLRNGHTESCGCIKSRGESKIIQLLKNNNISFETQKTFETCRFEDTKQLAKFDFYLVKYNCLIEYDGEQHYSCRSKGWNTKENLEKTQQHDNYKNQWCKENNIPLIRIPYTHYNELAIKDLLLESSQFII